MAEELTEEQKKREESREIALKNLNSGLWNYALPKLVSSEQYGKISEIVNSGYEQSLSQAPDQQAYERLFLPQLMSEEGAITSSYLQSRSFKILQESLFNVKVGDAVKYSGMKMVNEEIKDKYLSEIDKEKMHQIIGSCINYQADEKVKEILSLRQKGMSKNLEEILKAA